MLKKSIFTEYIYFSLIFNKLMVKYIMPNPPPPPTLKTISPPLCYSFIKMKDSFCIQNNAVLLIFLEINDH